MPWYDPVSLLIVIVPANAATVADQATRSLFFQRERIGSQLLSEQEVEAAVEVHATAYLPSSLKPLPCAPPPFTSTHVVVASPTVLSVQAPSVELSNATRYQQHLSQLNPSPSLPPPQLLNRLLVGGLCPQLEPAVKSEDIKMTTPHTSPSLPTSSLPILDRACTPSSPLTSTPGNSVAGSSPRRAPSLSPSALDHPVAEISCNITSPSRIMDTYPSTHVSSLLHTTLLPSHVPPMSHTLDTFPASMTRLSVASLLNPPSTSALDLVNYSSSESGQPSPLLLVSSLPDHPTSFIDDEGGRPRLGGVSSFLSAFKP